MRRLNSEITLYIFVFIAILPAIVMRDFTPANELRYMSIADEAIRDGHLFAFYNQGEPYADKPPLYFWIVMLGKQLFGSHQMRFLTLFSLIPAMVINSIMYRWTKPHMNAKESFVASSLLISCGLFLGVGLFLRMDMLMCMFITLALYSFWRMYVGEDGNMDKWLFPLFVFAALFSKGPVGILVPLTATITFLIAEGKWREIGKYWGWRTLSVLILCCGAWFVGVWAEGGSEYLNNLLFHQTLDRAVDAFHHKEPIWFYCGAIWWSMAPWSLLVIGTLVGSFFMNRRMSSLEKFFTTIISVTFIMLSAFSSKIAIYLLPIFPFAIYLTVLILPQFREQKWPKVAISIPAIIYLPAVAGVVYAGFTTELVPLLHNYWLVVAALILSLVGMITLWSLWRNNDIYQAVRRFVVGSFVAIFFAGFAMPYINHYIGYKTICYQAQSLAAKTSRDKIYTCNVKRSENMDVYLGCDVEKVSSEDVLSGRCGDGVVILKRSRLSKDSVMLNYVMQNPILKDSLYLVVAPSN